VDAWCGFHYDRREKKDLREVRWIYVEVVVSGVVFIIVIEERREKLGGYT